MFYSTLLQLFTAERIKVPHLKDLNKIYLEPEAQGLSVTFRVPFLKLFQNDPVSLHKIAFVRKYTYIHTVFSHTKALVTYLFNFILYWSDPPCRTF